MFNKKQDVSLRYFGNDSMHFHNYFLIRHLRFKHIYYTHMLLLLLNKNSPMTSFSQKSQAHLLRELNSVSTRKPVMKE